MTTIQVVGHLSESFWLPYGHTSTNISGQRHKQIRPNLTNHSCPSFNRVLTYAAWSRWVRSKISFTSSESPSPSPSQCIFIFTHFCSFFRLTQISLGFFSHAKLGVMRWISSRQNPSCRCNEQKWTDNNTQLATTKDQFRVHAFLKYVYFSRLIAFCCFHPRSPVISPTIIIRIWCTILHETSYFLWKYATAKNYSLLLIIRIIIFGWGVLIWRILLLF